MRRFFTAGFLALFVALFAGCSDQETQTPTEPDFGKKNKVTYNCLAYDLQDQLDALNAAAETIFMTRPTLKGALSNIDNMARKVCTDDPNPTAALDQYYELETLVNGQNEAKIYGGDPAREAFLAMAYSFATGGEVGDMWVIDPDDIASGDFVELVAPSNEGALRIEHGTFPSGELVTLVAYRLPDDYTGDDDHSFGDYAPYLVPEVWWFDANVQPDPLGPGFEAWVCLVDDNDPTFINRAVLAHAIDGGGVELLPKLTDNPPTDLDCADAEYMAIGPTSPGWLQLAGSVVRPVLKEIFGVKKLNAMYFKGTGLGGRGGSLSPFGGVDLGAETFDLSCTVSPYGGINLGGQGGCSFLLAPGGDIGAIGIVPVATGTLVPITIGAQAGYEITAVSGCTSGDGLTGSCDVLMDRDRNVTATFRPIPTTDTYTLTLDGAGAGDGTVEVSYPDATGGTTTEVCSYPLVGGACTFAIPGNVELHLTATAGTGATFDDWGGACDLVPDLDPDGTPGPDCYLIMFEAKTVSATFSPEVAGGYNLTITVIDDGVVSGGTGEVAITPCTSVNSPCLERYIGPVQVTLTAMPTGANTRILWSGVQCDWSGGVVGDGDTCIVDVAGVESVSVEFYNLGQ